MKKYIVLEYFTSGKGIAECSNLKDAKKAAKSYIAQGYQPSIWLSADLIYDARINSFFPKDENALPVAAIIGRHWMA